jgi:hypothetical protein
MVAVRNESRTVQALASPRANLRRDLIPDEADHAGRCEQPQVRERVRVDEAQERLHERHAGACEDREHDSEAG